MDYHQKMIVRPQNYNPKDNVADEDEDDLEALRLAALMSLKAKPSKILPPKSFATPINSFPIYSSNNNNKNHGSYRGRRDFYQNRPLIRQNGNPNVYYPSRNNQNLIEIIPVEENAPKDDKPSATPEKENSKFRRYDDASGSEDEDLKTKDTSDQPTSSITDLSEPVEPRKEDDQTDSELGEVSEAILLDEKSPKEETAPATEEENEDDDNEADKPDEDDDDIIIMADFEEEDSLERLMDEMEREMAGKPLDKKDKKPRRDKVKQKSKPEATVSSTSTQSYKDQPESLYERTRHRSPSPKAKRKKSPRRSPPRLKKPRQRSPRRTPPRSPKRLLSPRRRSRSRTPPRRRSKSPRRSPVRSSRSPKISPRRVSPRRISPHSPIHSPWSSPVNSPRLSPKRRRSPVPSTTSGNKEKELRKKRSKSPEETGSKSTKDLKENDISDPVLEARRRKFESTKLIDPVHDNKKIKLSRKAEEEDTFSVEDDKAKDDDIEEGEVEEISDEEKMIEDNGNEEIELGEETELCLDETYDLDELSEHVTDEAIFEPVKKSEKRPKKKKKKDKELYQVGKLKEIPLSERLGKEKKCKKRKEYEKVEEGNCEEVVDEEADLRTELSRRRAERLNRNVPIQSARLLQSAFKGVVNEVAKNNSKALQRQLIKEDKHPQKEMRRVTVLHRVPELHDSEDEIIDSKVPIKFRLGLNKVQETREPKSSRKSSKRQARKVKQKNLIAN